VPGFTPIQILQAVPTASGPDLYSTQLSSDGTQSVVQALTSDGRQLWQVGLPPLNKNSVPDGAGGLLVAEYDTCTPGQTQPLTVVDLDPVFGQPLWSVSAAGLQVGNNIVYCYGNGYDAPQIAVRGDGGVIISEPTNNGFPQLTVKNAPCCGSRGYSIAIPASTNTVNGNTINVQCCVGPPMVNSDGWGYVEYEVRNVVNNVVTSDSLYLLGIAPTDNSFPATLLSSTTQDQALLPGPIIPDGNGGVLPTWTISPSNPPVPQYPYQAVDVVSGVVGTPYNLPFSPKTVSFGQSPIIVLGEGGIAFATNGKDINNGPVIASFNLASGGGVNWSYQATTSSALSIMAVLSDGSLAINDSVNGVVQLGTTGTPTPVTGPLGGVAEYSWGGDWSMQGSQAAAGVALPLDVDAADIWATPSGNPSQNAAVGPLCGCLLQSTASGSAPMNLSNEPSAQDQSTNETDLVVQPASVPNCAICNLPPPVPPATSCTTLAGSGPTYLILVGDPGLPPHAVVQGFNLAAQQNANDLQSQGSKVIACRVSSVKDFNQALTTNGFIGGGVIYYGHSGPYGFGPQEIISILAVGQATGADTNMNYSNINEICPSGCDSVLGPNVSITINGCRAAVPVSGVPNDPTGISGTPIAKVLARQIGRPVYAYRVGMYFSLHDAAHATSTNWAGEPKTLPTSLPMYLIPEGTPGNKKSPIQF
jgi:hypothetical protein